MVMEVKLDDKSRWPVWQSKDKHRLIIIRTINKLIYEKNKQPNIIVKAIKFFTSMGFTGERELKET